MDINSWNRLDFVGDIHANSKKFISLLEKLGYVFVNDKWEHSENRQLVILGDFINAGFDNIQTLSILYKLWKSNKAIILLGNHEYFLAWYYFKFARTAFTSSKSPLINDYESLLNEFKNSVDELCVYTEWLLGFPLFIENDKFRAVHAYWSENNIEQIKPYKNLKQLFEKFENSKSKEKILKNAINETIEGLKIQLYVSCKMDKPVKYRVKWWQNIYNKPLPQSIMTHRPVKCPGIIVAPELLPGFKHYAETEIPVFFGHYWFQTLPYLLRNNVCCLDFGASKGGYLVAYRWNGEKELNVNNLVYL